MTWSALAQENNMVLLLRYEDVRATRSWLITADDAESLSRSLGDAALNASQLSGIPLSHDDAIDGAT